jgi:hypothetical protein
MTEIKALKNGMIMFDNGNDFLQVQARCIKSVHIFPPEPANYGCTIDKWRVQVSGEGYIVFASDTREKALDIVRRINEVMDYIMVI